MAERDLVLGVMRGRGDLYEFISKTRIRIEVNTLLFVLNYFIVFPFTRICSHANSKPIEADMDVYSNECERGLGRKIRIFQNI